MKVKIISIVIGAFGTVTKGLLKGLEDLEVGGRVETIQTTALLKTTRMLKRDPRDLRRVPVTQTPMKDHQLFCFTAYQHFSGHLTPIRIWNNSV